MRVSRRSGFINEPLTRRRAGLSEHSRTFGGQGSQVDTRGPNLGPRDTNFASVHIVPLPAIRVENVEKFVILYILNRLL